MDEPLRRSRPLHVGSLLVAPTARLACRERRTTTDATISARPSTQDATPGAGHAPVQRHDLPRWVVASAAVRTTLYHSRSGSEVQDNGLVTWWPMMVCRPPPGGRQLSEFLANVAQVCQPDRGRRRSWMSTGRAAGRGMGSTSWTSASRAERPTEYSGGSRPRDRKAGGPAPAVLKRCVSPFRVRHYKASGKTSPISGDHRHDLDEARGVGVAASEPKVPPCSAPRG